MREGRRKTRTGGNRRRREFAEENSEKRAAAEKDAAVWIQRRSPGRAFTAAPRKYGYADSFPNYGREEADDGKLNFYSCAGEAAIFRGIKWALKLSGQFRRRNVLLFSSTASSSTASRPPLLRSVALFPNCVNPFRFPRDTMRNAM